MSTGRNDGDAPQSSADMYQVLLRQPLDVELACTIQAKNPGQHEHGAGFYDQHILYRVSLKDNDRQTIDLFGGANSPSPPSVRLATSATTQPLTPWSCIRSVEIALDSSGDMAPVPLVVSLESLCASTNISFCGKAMLANGYQSWSTSPMGADESFVFEKPNSFYHQLTHLGLASDMHIFEYPGAKGKLHANLFTVIRSKCVDLSLPIVDQPSSHSANPEELVLCGSLSEDVGFTYFLMDTDHNRLTIAQDCLGKKLHSGNDKLVLRTFFAWGDKDTVVWDAYEAAWRSIYQDRRLVTSSLYNQQSGWTSWYLYQEKINQDIVLDHLSHYTGYSGLLPQDNTGNGWPARVFQIDDGYTIVGDWLDYNKTKFPRGMAFIANEIRNKGLVPGLWLAPFLASTESQIVREHPEWFVKVENLDDKLELHRKQHNLCTCHTGGAASSTGLFLPTRPLSGTGITTKSPCLMLAHPAFSAGAYAIDLENVQVQDHLAHIFRVVTREWGFKMLKLDFLFAAAHVARNGKTRGQLQWEAMQMARSWAGSETILLGCGVPLGSSFMTVDYCRIGCDVSPSWDTMQRHFHDREYVSCFNSLTSTLSRWALSGRFFGNDPDVFYLRDWEMGLTRVERRTLMLLNHLLGHLVFCSDPLDISRMSQDDKSTLSLYYPWPTTPGAPASITHHIYRVLQPLPRQKDVYMIHVQGGKDGQCTFLVVSNLSSQGQHVCLNVMDKILERQANGAEQGWTCSSIYFNPDMGQFGSSGAVFWIKPRETSVFMRVMDHLGRPCGLSPTFVRPGYNSSLLDSIHMDGSVYLVATKGGHVLPTTEIKSFERDAKHQHRLTLTFWSSFFPKTVT
ncbi:hypothetical protein BGX31_011606, partial [Mortierella sp. GBA43]